MGEASTIECFYNGCQLGTRVLAAKTWVQPEASHDARSFSLVDASPFDTCRSFSSLSWTAKAS